VIDVICYYLVLQPLVACYQEKR